MERLDRPILSPFFSNPTHIKVKTRLADILGNNSLPDPPEARHFLKTKRPNEIHLHEYTCKIKENKKWHTQRKIKGQLKKKEQKKERDGVLKSKWQRKEKSEGNWRENKQTKPGRKVIGGLDYSTAVVIFLRWLTFFFFYSLSFSFFSSFFFRGGDLVFFFPPCPDDAAVLGVGVASPAHKAN